jgi:hypothetical protein
MPIKLKCSCGQVLTVSDALAGKTGKCPKCQKAIKIPVPGAATAAPSSAAKPAATPAAPGKPTAATSKPAAARPAGARPAAAPPRTAAAAQASNDSLFDEIGLKKQTGPTCPKCGGAISPSAALCTHCGFNLQTGEQAIGFQARAEREEFTNPFLQEAANNMRAEILSEERHAQAGTPWWMLASFLVGALCIGAAGIVIVDATMNEPAPPNTLLGRVQRQSIGVVAGVTFAAVGILIGNLANLSIIIYAFRQSIGRGFAVWLIPFYSIIYGCSTWADNKTGIFGIIMGIVLASAGMALAVATGGIK